MAAYDLHTSATVTSFHSLRIRPLLPLFLATFCAHMLIFHVTKYEKKYAKIWLNQVDNSKVFTKGLMIWNGCIASPFLIKEHGPDNYYLGNDYRHKIEIKMCGLIVVNHMQRRQLPRVNASFTVYLKRRPHSLELEKIAIQD